MEKSVEDRPGVGILECLKDEFCVDQSSPVKLYKSTTGDPPRIVSVIPVMPMPKYTDAKYTWLESLRIFESIISIAEKRDKKLSTGSTADITGLGVPTSSSGLSKRPLDVKYGDTVNAKRLINNSGPAATSLSSAEAAAAEQIVALRAAKEVIRVVSARKAKEEKKAKALAAAEEKRLAALAAADKNKTPVRRMMTQASRQQIEGWLNNPYDLATERITIDSESAISP